MTGQLPKSLPASVKSNGKLSSAVNPTDGSFSLTDVESFEDAGRAFVQDELVSWDGRTITATPAGDLLNVVRGIGGTTAASHASTNSVYNSWFEERIELQSAVVNDRLPNYDPFPDVRSLNDPTPGTIQLITERLVIVDGFQKLGIDRSANEIQDNFEQRANDLLDGLRADSIMIEPRAFTDVLTFGQEDVLLDMEAPLAKRHLDPWTASIANFPIKFIPLNPDEMKNPALPRRLKSEEFSTSIRGFIYFSDLQNRWIFRSISTDIVDGQQIGYQFTEHRNNWAHKRRAEQQGWGNLVRG